MKLDKKEWQSLIGKYPKQALQGEELNLDTDWKKALVTVHAIALIYVNISKMTTKLANQISESFDTAMKNTGPVMEVRSRRVGGANYQVPREVRPERRQALSMKWIIDAARSKKGQPMHMKLADELIAAAKGEGEAVKKRENVHKMAEANKAFAHFAW